MLRGSSSKRLLLLSLNWKLIRLQIKEMARKLGGAAEWGFASARETGASIVVELL